MATIELTPKAFAIEVVDLTEKSIEDLGRWLDARGLAQGRAGKIRKRNDETGYTLRTTHGEEPLHGGDWVVLYAGELHVMSPTRWNLLVNGTTGE